VAWQQEGYDMFQELMKRIEDDYVRYVLQVQVVGPEMQGMDLGQASYYGATDPGDASLLESFQAAQVGQASAVTVAERPVTDVEVNSPLIKSDEERVGRNDPCYCGSGLKYKHCHGK
jgi:preprotein translocase subunit SecA